MKETGSNGVCDIGSNPDSTVDLTAPPLQPSMSAICLTVVVSVVFPSKGCYEDYLVINNCIYAGDDNDLYSFTKCFLFKRTRQPKKTGNSKPCTVYQCHLANIAFFTD